MWTKSHSYVSVPILFWQKPIYGTALIRKLCRKMQMAAGYESSRPWPRHYWLQNTEYLQLHLIASSIDWLLKGYCCLSLSRAAFVTRDNKCDNSTEPWCTCTQSSMSQESFNHQVLKIMEFHKPTNKPMLRSLQWSTWNIVKEPRVLCKTQILCKPWENPSAIRNIHLLVTFRTGCVRVVGELGYVAWSCDGWEICSAVSD